MRIVGNRQPLQSEVAIAVFAVVAHRCTRRVYCEGSVALIKGQANKASDSSDTLHESTEFK